MKNIKTKLLVAVASFLFLFALAPAAKVEAASAPAPKNITAWNQNGSELSVCWDLDASLKNKVKGKTFGYDILFQTTSGTTIKRLTEKSVRFTSDLSTCVVTAYSSKFASAPVKVKIRTYVVSGSTKVWSGFVTKYIVPRAKITGGSLASGTTKARIYWNKVTGAASYSLYVSYDGGKTFKKATTTTGTAATTGSLKMNKIYRVYVQANKVKCGSYTYNSTYMKYTSSRIANTWGFKITYGS